MAGRRQDPPRGALPPGRPGRHRQGHRHARPGAQGGRPAQHGRPAHGVRRPHPRPWARRHHRRRGRQERHPPAPGTPGRSGRPRMAARPAHHRAAAERRRQLPAPPQHRPRARNHGGRRAVARRAGRDRGVAAHHPGSAIALRPGEPRARGGRRADAAGLAGIDRRRAPRHCAPDASHGQGSRQRQEQGEG